MLRVRCMKGCVGGRYFDAPGPSCEICLCMSSTGSLAISASVVGGKSTTRKTDPPAGGSVFRVVDFPPTTDAEIAKLPVDDMHKQISHDGPGASKYRPPTHPFMHRTRSIDYAIVMSGEIDMKLDEEEIHLEEGDVLVQQGTNHAWINRSGKPCRIAFILIDAAEP